MIHLNSQNKFVLIKDCFFSVSCPWGHAQDFSHSLRSGSGGVGGAATPQAGQAHFRLGLFTLDVSSAWSSSPTSSHSSLCLSLGSQMKFPLLENFLSAPRNLVLLPITLCLVTPLNWYLNADLFIHLVFVIGFPLHWEHPAHLRLSRA